MYKLHTRIILPTALPQLRTFAEMKVFSYHSVAVTVKLIFLWLQDFESVSSDCTDAVRGAFHQLKELAESQGNEKMALI